MTLISPAMTRLALAAAFLAAAALPAWADPATGAEAALRSGIDVSGHSGHVDWKSVADEGHDFVILKASEGVDLADPAFEKNWARAREAGLRRGAYHFYVTEDDPEAQARFFLSRVAFEPGDIAPVVDIELIGHGTKPGLAGRLKRFLEIVEDEVGVKPIIYTSPNFWNEHVGPGFGEHPLWLAEYGVEEPTIPDGWDAWHLWQWQGDAQVSGVEKTADLNRVSADLDVAALVIPD